MAHISWQGSPKEANLGHISPVSQSPKTFIPPPSITQIAFVVASAAFNCWFLFVREGKGLLSKVDSCVERPPGHWDSIMTWGRCRPKISSCSDGLACNTKAMADNGRQLIEKYSSKCWHIPWREQTLLQGSLSSCKEPCSYVAPSDRAKTLKEQVLYLSSVWTQIPSPFGWQGVSGTECQGSSLQGGYWPGLPDSSALAVH